MILSWPIWWWLSARRRRCACVWGPPRPWRCARWSTVHYEKPRPTCRKPWMARWSGICCESMALSWSEESSLHHSQHHRTCSDQWLCCNQCWRTSQRLFYTLGRMGCQDRSPTPNRNQWCGKSLGWTTLWASRSWILNLIPRPHPWLAQHPYLWCEQQSRGQRQRNGAWRKVHEWASWSRNQCIQQEFVSIRHWLSACFP